MMMKIVHDKQIHLYRGEKTMKSIKAHCQTIFKQLPAHYCFYYIDED